MATLADAIHQLNQQTQTNLGALATLVRKQLDIFEKNQQQTQSAGASFSGAPLGGIVSGLIQQYTPGAFRGVTGAGRQAVSALGRLFATGAQIAGGAGASAGAGGAASGGAGAAGAAAATGPIMAAVAAIVVLGVAVAKLPGKIAEWGDALLDSQRKLAQFSAAMAGVIVRSDIRNMVRDIRVGNATAGSAGDMARAIGDLKDELVHMRIFWANLENRLIELLARGMNPLVALLDRITLDVEILVGQARSTGQMPIQGQIVQFAIQEAEKKAAADRQFLRNPFRPGP